MSQVIEFLTSYFIVTIVVSWLLGCILKAVVEGLKNNSFRLSRGFENGGMPSNHSIVAGALTTAVYLTSGLGTLFFIALTFSAIAVSDAAGVRRYVGKQGQALNELLIKNKKKPLKITYGHTPLQAFVGVLWGIAFAIGFYYIFF